MLISIREDPTGLIEAIARDGASASRTTVESLDRVARGAFLAELRSRTDDRFGKIIRTYIPGEKFSSISVTGTNCDLGCKHCDRKYLHGMVPATTPDELDRVLRQIEAGGGEGALVSGGSTREGIVELQAFHGVLASIKQTTSLKLNLHVGLIDKQAAESLYAAGIDEISLDVVGDDATIQDVYGLQKSVTDYMSIIENLMVAGFTNEQIVPHICIGLHFGEIRGEYAALDLIKPLDPRLIAFIVLIPPKTIGVQFTLVSPDDVRNVIATARALYPDADLSLGCMRPGGSIRISYDLAAFDAGITRIALPTKGFLTRATSRGYTVEAFSHCCTMD
jgi:hypothetical protein